jgi:threonine dehydratase
MIPTIDDIRAAAERIAPFALRTPVLTCSWIDRQVAVKCFFKCENFQKVGAFKFRGACNAVFSLGDTEAKRGVVTHSSGNHAQALALAAKLRSIPATIVMPTTAPAAKRAAVMEYGAKIVPCEPAVESRETTCRRVVEETGGTMIHPYNDVRVIAGQGTAAMELLAERPDLDVILVPVGGGGLASGTALAAAALAPQCRVIGVEPAAADDARRSLAEGRILPSNNPRTVADGLRTSLGELTFDILRRHAHAILAVSEEGIIQTMRHVWERMKIVIEPSSAVPVAALWEHRSEIPGTRIGIIISGGNLDLDRLPWQ